MNGRRMKNEKGFTLIELLIAMGMSVILLGAAMYTYTKQDSLLRNENKQSKLRDYARLAMDELDGRLRMAGYGFPPGNMGAGRPALGVTAATATSITFRANTDDFTFFVVDPTPVTAASNFVRIDNPLGSFAVNDNVVVFNAERPGGRNFGPLTVVSNGFDIIAFGQANNTYTSGTSDLVIDPLGDTLAVLVNKYHTYTYTYDAGNQIITLFDDGGTDDGGGDDTTVTVASQVSSLTFNYFAGDGTPLTTLPLDATDRGDLRGIEIDITVVDNDDATATISIVSGVQLRNMGT
jgi:prepilin-type N-terminal cleavage/methylation domain-containing protein